jgi:hypothetical protein
MDPSHIAINIKYGIPRILEKTLYDLHTISQINRGEKVSTTNEYLSVDEDNILLQMFSRMMRGDDRDKAVKKICYTVDLAIEYGDAIMESRFFMFIEKYSREVLREDISTEMHIFHAEYLQRKNWMKLIHARLSNSLLGLSNFVQTYQTDGNVVGMVQPMVVKAREAVNKFETFLSRVEHTERGSAWYKRFNDTTDKEKAK